MDREDEAGRQRSSEAGKRARETVPVSVTMDYVGANLSNRPTAPTDERKHLGRTSKHAGAVGAVSSQDGHVRAPPE